MKPIAITLIKENGSIVNAIVPMSSVNNLFFSELFCQGKVEEAWKNYLIKNNVKENRQQNYPGKSGLILIDLPNQSLKIYSFYQEKFYQMDVKDVCYQIGSGNHVRYEHYRNELNTLIKKELLIFHTRDNQEHHIMDFFDTTDPHKINQYFKNTYNSNISNGYFRPKSFNLNITYYIAHQLNFMLKDMLSIGVKLTEEEIIEWKTYAKTFGRTQQEKETKQNEIEEIIEVMSFYHTLQKDLKENMSSIQNKI